MRSWFAFLLFIMASLSAISATANLLLIVVSGSTAGVASNPLEVFNRLYPGAPSSVLESDECLPVHSMEYGATGQRPACLLRPVPGFGTITIAHIEGNISGLHAFSEELLVANVVARWGRPVTVRPLGRRDNEQMFELVWGKGVSVAAYCGNFLTLRCKVRYMELYSVNE